MLGVPAVFETMHKRVWKQAESSGMAGKMQKMMTVARRTGLFNNQKVMRRIFFEDTHELGKQYRAVHIRRSGYKSSGHTGLRGLGIPDDTGIWHDGKFAYNSGKQGQLQQGRFGRTADAGNRSEDSRRGRRRRR